MQNLTHTQQDAGSFIRCWFPLELNILMALRLCRPIWSFQTLCRRYFPFRIQLQGSRMSGLFNITCWIKLCLPTPNCSKLDSSSLISALSEEYLYHLFYDCSYARSFWDTFNIWWSDLRGKNFRLTPTDVIVGLFDNNTPISLMADAR